VSIHADPLFISSEVERRLELAGFRRDGHDHVAPAPALGTHPLAALVARLVGGHAGPATPVRREVATRRPRHP
jgi:UDP-N-acetylmuramyl pentapeptide synthase